MLKILFMTVCVGSLVPILVTTEHHDSKCSEAIESFTTASIRVTSILLRYFITPNETTVNSPVLILLLSCDSLLFNGEGPARDQLLDLLNFNNYTDKEIKCACHTVAELISAQNNKGRTFTLPSIITSADKRHLFKPGFISESKYIANARSVNYNFNKPEMAARKINELTAVDTDGKIDYVISSTPLNTSLGLVHTAALYYQTYNKNMKVINGIFSLTPCKNVNTRFLSGLRELKYIESSELGVKAIEAFTERTGFSTLAIIPTEYCKIKSLLRKIENPGVFRDLRESMKFAMVNLTHPVLYTDTLYDASKAPSETGLITTLGNPETANFQDVAYGHKELVVSIGHHRVLVNHVINSTVDESEPVGTESPPTDVKEFFANRPYIYYILVNGIPIASSYIGNPENQLNQFVDPQP